MFIFYSSQDVLQKKAGWMSQQYPITSPVPWPAWNISSAWWSVAPEIFWHVHQGIDTTTGGTSQQILNTERNLHMLKFIWNIWYLHDQKSIFAQYPGEMDVLSCPKHVNLNISKINQYCVSPTTLTITPPCLNLDRTHTPRPRPVQRRSRSAIPLCAPPFLQQQKPPSPSWDLKKKPNKFHDYYSIWYTGWLKEKWRKGKGCFFFKQGRKCWNTDVFELWDRFFLFLLHLLTWTFNDLLYRAGTEHTRTNPPPTSSWPLSSQCLYRGIYHGQTMDLSKPLPRLRKSSQSGESFKTTSNHSSFFHLYIHLDSPVPCF